VHEENNHHAHRFARGFLINRFPFVDCVSGRATINHFRATDATRIVGLHCVASESKSEFSRIRRVIESGYFYIARLIPARTRDATPTLCCGRYRPRRKGDAALITFYDQQGVKSLFITEGRFCVVCNANVCVDDRRALSSVHS